MFGRLHVIGGETSFPPPEDDVFSSSQGVYDHTALYNPARSAWQWGASMPTAVHGVVPVRENAADTLTWPCGPHAQAGPSSISIISLTSSRDLMPEVHTPVTALPHALPLHATPGTGWQCGVFFRRGHMGRMVAVKQTAGPLDRARNSDLRRRKLADSIERRGRVRHILDCRPMPCVGDVR